MSSVRLLANFLFAWCFDQNALVSLRYSRKPRVYRKYFSASPAVTFFLIRTHGRRNTRGGRNTQQIPLYLLSICWVFQKSICGLCPVTGINTGCKQGSKARINLLSLFHFITGRQTNLTKNNDHVRMGIMGSRHWRKWGVIWCTDEHGSNVVHDIKRQHATIKALKRFVRKKTHSTELHNKRTLGRSGNSYKSNCRGALFFLAKYELVNGSSDSC